MKDVQFMSAKDKELTLKRWKTFISKGLKEKHFTKRIYQHLNLHCSFIAHYNRSGFYHTYFVNPESTIQFFDRFCDSGISHWYRDPDYSDLNSVMVEVAEEYRSTSKVQLKQTIKERDLLIAKQLLEKHGVDFEVGLAPQRKRKRLGLEK